MKGVILVGSFDDFRDMFYNVYSIDHFHIIIPRFSADL